MKNDDNYKLILSIGKEKLLNNFKQDFKKRSVVKVKGITFSTFISWSFENDDWKVVKQHQATKLVFRIHLKKNNGRKRLIHRSFVKINLEM